MADRIGQQLGNYRLIRLLGRGGFAEVYLGEHLRLKTQVAVKILHTSLEDDDVESFLREAQIVAHLKHPHIVRVFDFDVENHTPFLVMDYLPNGNVRRSYPKGTSLPPEAIVSYVQQVASALQYAHDQKLIHRDIKPENMLLDRDNTIVLSDFGIALMAQSSRYQNTQEVAGTAAYMAPEQFQGHPHRASDQYALGVVVYEWLTGDRPFHGSFSEIASQHLFVPPSSLREKIPTISPGVEQVVLTALEKDPHKRFGRVQAFATALEQACQTTSTRPVALTPEITYPGQSLPKIVAGPPRQPSLPTNVMTPQSQPLQPTNVVTPSGQLSQPTDMVIPSSAPTIYPPAIRESVPSGGTQSSNLPRHQASAEPLNRKSIDRDGKIRVWSIGVRQVAAMIISIALYGVIIAITNFLHHDAFVNYYLFPSPIDNTMYWFGFTIFVFGLFEVIPLFSGVIFGPWAGLFIGGGGLLIGIFMVEIFRGQHSWLWGWNIFLFYKPLEIALMGFIAGLALLITKGRYNTLWRIVIAEGFGILGKVIASCLLILLGSLISGAGANMSFEISRILSSLFFSLPALALLPLLLVAYNVIIKHRRILVRFLTANALISTILPSSVRALVLSGGSQPSNPRLSRRTFVVSLAGLTGLTIVGGGAWWVWLQRQDPATLFTYSDPRGDEITDVAWVSNGKRIASTGANVDTTVRVWDATTGSNIISHPGSWTLASSPDGTRIASAENGTVNIWDVDAGSTLLSYCGHCQDIGVSAIAWSPDGKRIASAGWSNDPRVQVWDTATGKTIFIYPGQNNFIHTVTWAPDGKHVASANGKDLVIWDANTGKTILTLHGDGGPASWSPDGKRIASISSRFIVIWDANTGKTLLTYPGDGQVAWSPDGNRIAFGGDGHTIQVWNPTTGQHLYTYHGHSDYVSAVRWAPDSQRIASASNDGTVQVWRVP